MKIVLLFFTCLFYIAAATDYCNKDLCKEYVGDGQYAYNHHIACKNNGQVSPSCPSDVALVELTKAVEDQILKLHNEYRNTLASGSLEGFESAKRLAPLKWNDELAQLAELNVITCNYGHDACHNTDTFPFSGQNIAISSFSGQEIEDSKNIEDLVNSWWKEHKKAVQSQLDLFGEGPPSNHILHFTAMSHEKTGDVGCGMATWTDASGTKNFYLVCNYGFTNLLGEPIYRKGAACSDCKTGCDTTYPALCSHEEKISSKPNGF